MALVKVKDILKHATEHKYGVAAINTINVETIKYAILAAEQEKVPLIIQFYPGLCDYVALKYIAYTACDMAKKVSVPIGVHLDHSNTYEIALSGIRDGFPSVMIDGPSLKYDENIISLEALLNRFWKIIDPTILNRQGGDIGHQYRTGIYYIDEEDVPTILKTLEEQKKKYAKPIVTEIEPLKCFYDAEEYHQKYLKKNPNGYCHIDMSI
mgnify:CR=1 FL=1